ncbi:SPOR domain-containing protein, partial [Bordetella petrii]
AQPPAAKPPAAPPKPAEAPRDDDGARALALLEGRAPSQPAPTAKPQATAKGNFVLQIASYSSQSDAQARRSKLHQAGITNAFVEQASVGGKQQYRLRVGPFPSRDAAQAAQARLRTLGYDNGFIASQ